ncbi:MAG: hypothetical protein IKY26_03595 [Erysipelotrichaceae bacterium]|nr:hypothetical protein [Erysipelotrichaceae bacterium]
MFEFLTKKKVFETVDVDKKNQVLNMLKEKGIDYIVRKGDINHRSALDTFKMGELMVKPKYVYVFWVKKNQANEAEVIMKTVR